MGSKKIVNNSPPPDPQIGAAAAAQGQVAADSLAFAKQQHADLMKRQEGLDAINRRVVEQQMSTQDWTNERAKADAARYDTVAKPGQDRMVSEANAYDTPEKQAEAAARIRADIIGSSGIQREMAGRQMASLGVNPNSGRFQGQMRSQDLDTALAMAGGQNGARESVVDKGRMLRAGAIDMLAGLPATSANSAALGLNAGNSAAGNMGSAMGSARANSGVMQAGFGQGMQGYGGMGKTFNDLYANQNQAQAINNQANAQNMGAAGSLIGLATNTGLTIW